LRKPRLQKIAALLQGDQIPLAEKELTDHLDRNPADVDALSLMAQTQMRLGRLNTAAALLMRCLELAPDFMAARFEYAKMLFRLSRYTDSLRETEILLTADGGNPLFRRLKAHNLSVIGDDRDSLDIWKQLVDEEPDRAESWIVYGHALRENGRSEESIAAYRKALQLRPSSGLAWWSLANMKTVRFTDSDVAAMQEQLNRTDMTPDDRVNTQFALGRASEDRNLFGKSFEHYAKGNAALRLRLDHDWDAVDARIAKEKDLFTSTFFESRRNAGCKAPDPIFVVGRPRSGSTLIDQILSSHSAIEGTAELPYIPALAARLEERECLEHGIDYPGILEKLDSSALTGFGEEYLERARVHRKQGRPFFIDKSPNNYYYVALIHLILPNAKIIDARRHPVACCFSNFKQNFASTNFRLSELGHVYRNYVALLAHFDRVLPGRIHRVIYEDMVANPEAEIRKMLDYLGLPFEESCLRFYESDRAVRTPSSEQVRKPISSEAVDHWRHFEPWLGSLIKSLGTVLMAYPSVPDELL
jgi:tetratricopeptide (TPR) repeat protein